jgi:hypothetical protein
MILEEALKKAAYKVWDELEPIPLTPNYKVFEVREEALTTMLIKEIFRANCREIEKIEMISPQDETIKGYDFELAIGSKSKGKYVRLFIQAKTLKGKLINSNYNEIKFAQTDSLIQHSKSQSSLGVYAFFNHLTENDLTLNNHYNSATLFDKKSLGITIASAYSVKMLNSRKFCDFHFNNGYHLSPSLYSLRFFPHLFYFHKLSRSHLAIPFHELSYFTIELAETINRMYRKMQAQSRTHFFFFIFPGLEDFLNGDKDIIPIIETNIEKLVSDFKNRTIEINKTEGSYNPQFLLVINTDNQIE